jgi:hypothetical protein
MADQPDFCLETRGLLDALIKELNVDAEIHPVLENEKTIEATIEFEGLGEQKILDITGNQSKAIQNIDFTTETNIGLFKHIDYDTQGQPDVITYYKTYTPNADPFVSGSYSDPVVQVSYTFTRDPFGFVTSITRDFSWLNRDESVASTTKTLTRHYDPTFHMEEKMFEKQNQRRTYYKVSMMDTKIWAEGGGVALATVNIATTLLGAWSATYSHFKEYERFGTYTNLVAALTTIRDSYAPDTTDEYKLIDHLITDFTTNPVT